MEKSRETEVGGSVGEHDRKGSHLIASFQEEEAPKQKAFCGRIPTRYVLTFMGFLGFCNVYAMRVNLSVALVAMVNQTYLLTNADNVTNQMECPKLVEETNTPNDMLKGEKYNWDVGTQSIILGSFFYGYVIPQIPAGIFAEKWGAKWLFGIGVGITALFSLITPLAAEWGTTAFIVVRVIEGLGEGVTIPAMNALMSRWSPKCERSRLTTIVYTGTHIGNVIALPISGYLCASDFLGGWPSVFYVFGIIGCIWFVFWIILVYDNPRDHPRISKEELFLIQDGVGEIKPQDTTIPWKSIVTSIPLWALLITHFGQNWGFLILLTELPTYLNNILHFDIQKNSALSALPYLLKTFVAWFTSYVADKLRKSGRFRITTIRKTFNTIGFIGPAVCLLGVTLSGCHPMLIVSLLALALAFNGATYSGFNVTHVDMSPDFAGTLMGITNGFSNLSGFLGPALVGYFTSSGQTTGNWNKVFYVTSGMYVFTALVYLLFATAELQPWGLTSPEKKKDLPEKDTRRL